MHLKGNTKYNFSYLKFGERESQIPKDQTSSKSVISFENFVGIFRAYSFTEFSAKNS